MQKFVIHPLYFIHGFEPFICLIFGVFGIGLVALVLLVVTYQDFLLHQLSKTLTFICDSWQLEWGIEGCQAGAF